MAVSLAPFLKQRFFDANGNPLSGGKVHSYQAGTTTPQATYTDSTGATPNANPVILDANGEAAIWLDVALSYKFVIKNSSDVDQFTTDGVIGLSTNNSVATASLQDGAVTSDKLADDSVTAAKLRDDVAVDANRAVTTNHIRDGAVNLLKLDNVAISEGVSNISLTTSVAANALTVALKAFSGSDASASNPIKIRFRSSTASDGVPVVRSVTGALSVVVPSATTLGTSSGVAEYLYVFAIDNAGTVELALSASAYPDEGAILNTTAISGGTARGTLYSTTARTGVGIRLLGRILITEATAGTWASNATAVSVVPFSSGPRSQVRLHTHSGFGSTNNKIPIFTTTVDNYGTAITYATSAANGASFTINEDGIYTASFCMDGTNASGNGGPGLSLNSAELTTSVVTITAASRLAACLFNGAVSNKMQPGCASWTGFLKAGDVVRPHTQGAAPDTAALSAFTICQVSR